MEMLKWLHNVEVELSGVYVLFGLSRGEARKDIQDMQLVAIDSFRSGARVRDMVTEILSITLPEAVELQQS